MLKKLFSFFVLCSSILFAQIGPRATVQVIDYNFGNIARGSTVSHKFYISNNGGALLVLSDVRASCGCTVTQLDKTEIHPGDSATLTVQFDSDHKSGPQKKTIYVRTNDPNHPILRMHISGDVLDPNSPVLRDTSQAGTPALFFPITTHSFGKVKEGAVLDYTFDFYNKGGAVLKISNIETTCGCTAALASRREIPPSEKGKIRVEFDTSGKVGRVSRKIIVTSNDPAQPKRELTVFAEIKKEK